MSNTNEYVPVTVDEIQSLRAEISLMHTALAHNVVVRIPSVKKVAELFVAKGLEEAWIEKLLAPLAGSIFEEDNEMLVAYVLEELDSLLMVQEEDKNFEKKVHILMGSTGIGKTSLIGKLGARYSYLLEKTYRVAFINLDEHKIGAVEQLAHYADAMEIPLLSLDEIFDEQYDCLFIDTAGNMGIVDPKLNEIIALIESESDYKIEISLVLSATSKTKDLEKILEGFSTVAIDNFIFTKLDETYDLSDMINFLIKYKKPVTYLSTGQEIPEDLRVATKEYLLNQFMHEA